MLAGCSRFHSGPVTDSRKTKMVNLAQAGLAEAEAQRYSTLVRSCDVARSSFDAQQMRWDSARAQARMELARRLLDLATSQREAGAATAIDVVRAESKLAS